MKEFDSDVVTIHSWNVNGFRAVNKKGNFEDFLKKGRIVSSQKIQALCV